MSTATPHRFDAVVAGGGVAGVTAAVELARRGAAVALVEARPYLGGRVRSFHHRTTGEEIDNGQHLLMGAYTATFNLLDQLGTRALVETQPRLHVEFRDSDGGIDHFTAPSLLPTSLALVAAVGRMRSFRLADMPGLLRLGLAVRSTIKESLTVSDMFERCGVSSRMVDQLWRPLTIATLNTPPEEASAQLFASVLRLGFMGPRQHARLAVPRAGLSHLLAPALDYIQARGGSVYTGATVEQIGRGEKTFEVALRNGNLLCSEGVIIALPLPSIPRTVEPPLLPATVQRLAAAYSPSPIVSGYLWFDRALDTVPEFCALRGSMTEWVFNRRRIDLFPAPSSAPAGLLSVTISAADERTGLDDRSLLATVEAELRRWLPELGDAAMIDGIVLREKRATFRATPGFERIRSQLTTHSPVPGIAYAGDWTDTGLPGTIEGAARSGLRAANCLLSR